MQEQRASAEAPAGSTLLSAHQVQELLAVDSSTIYRMASDGRLPAVKVGKQWRFPAAAVQALLAAGGTPPAAVRGVDAGAQPGHTEQTVQAVLDVSAVLLGVMMVATDMGGRPVSQVANPCPWFEQRADDEATVTACTAEWRALADDLDFTPRFRAGSLGFECARVFVRNGSELVGMVLAGGVAPPGEPRDGLHQLDDDQRRAVLTALPTISAVLSRAATSDTTTRRSG